ncbi:protein kinase-like domain-containing protein [Xylariomycetidae sp. FL2044]|nr:protein kinase-like domain-containing protein [Xylariomycetidae sp. FL2044]
MSSDMSRVGSLSWKTSEYDPSDSVHSAIQETNWTALCELASRLNDNLDTLLRTSAVDLTKLRNEIDIMRCIKDRSDLPVPRIFAYEVDQINLIGAPFILMDFIPGDTTMDAAGGYEVQVTTIRFPKIGVIKRSEGGKYDIGPFPTIGPAERVLTAIHEFPSQVRAMASRLSRHDHDHGPFPLRHADFMHSNIIVDEDFESVDIIDWEGACTLPLHLVELPAFPNAMPAAFDLPENYGEDGLPLDEEEKERWRDREAYVEIVRLAEGEDNVLSTCLGNEKGLALSYAMGAFKRGKLGLYDRVMEKQGDAG